MENKIKSGHMGGVYGILACQDSIKSKQKETGRSYQELLEEYKVRAKNDPLFNKNMIKACELLIQESVDKASKK